MNSVNSGILYKLSKAFFAELPKTKIVFGLSIIISSRALLKETGARCGEIAELKWESIDYEQLKVRIKARA